MPKTKWKLQYKSMLIYLFFGICTTVTNLIVYYICARIMYFSTSISTLIAWFFAVAFAFFTNKIWVFESKSWKMSVVMQEILSFLVCRIITGILDLVIMLVTVEVLSWNDIIMKAGSNMLVILLNYVASKLIIFKEN